MIGRLGIMYRYIFHIYLYIIYVTTVAVGEIIVLQIYATSTRTKHNKSNSVVNGFNIYTSSDQSITYINLIFLIKHLY